MSFLSYFKILRPGNCLMAAIAVFIGFSVARGSIAFSIQLLLAMLSAFLICGAGQTINDYFDRGIDKLIKPEKLIPTGKIKAKNALIYSIALFLIGVIIAYGINSSTFAIALAFSILLIFYSASMQRFKFLGNFVVAAGTAFTLIYGAAVVGNYSVVIFFAVTAFLVNVGREIIKDVEDMPGDRGVKKTLPMIFSKKTIDEFVFSLYSAGIIIALSVWFLGLIKSILYLIFIVISGLIFSYSFYLLIKNKLQPSQQFSKCAMVAALIAFIAGVL